MGVGEWTLVVMWTGMTAYVLLGGADFGGGVWDLLAGSPHRGRETRRLIEHQLGPIWEANHVWLIFVVVVAWTGFPAVYAALFSTLYIPLSLVAIGIIARGSAFAFRKVSSELWQQRLFGGIFALASLLTPFFLGAVAGAIASGRVPPGVARGDVLTSWLTPTSLMTGALSVAVMAYLAAVFLLQDSVRSAPHLTASLRTRALGAGLAAGGLSLAALLVVRADARPLYDALTRAPALPVTIVAVLAGAVSIGLILARQYVLVRLTAGLTVAALLWAWAIAQYPYLLPPGISIEEAKASDGVLLATLGSLAVGAVLLVPSMLWLYYLFQRSGHSPDAEHTDNGGASQQGRPTSRPHPQS